MNIVIPMGGRLRLACLHHMLESLLTAPDDFVPGGWELRVDSEGHVPPKTKFTIFRSKDKPELVIQRTECRQGHSCWRTRDTASAMRVLVQGNRRFISRISVDDGSGEVTVLNVHHPGTIRAEICRVAATVIQAAYRGMLGRRHGDHIRYAPGGPGFQEARCRFLACQAAG